MDFEQVEAWLFTVDNYFNLVGLTDPIAQYRYAITLLSKSAAIWLRNQNFDLTKTTWPTLQHAIRSYFRPADYKRRARDELHKMR